MSSPSIRFDPHDAWNKVLMVDLIAPFRLTQAVANKFFSIQGKGAVVNIASTESLQAHSANRVGTGAYYASKGAVINMTRALAASGGPNKHRRWHGRCRSSRLHGNCDRREKATHVLGDGCRLPAVAVHIDMNEIAFG